VEKVKVELEKSKRTETALKKQNERLKEVHHLKERIEPEITEEEEDVREKLEKEMTELAVTKTRLENVLREVKYLLFGAHFIRLLQKIGN
jgi:hypothetical protein